jgi:hypothetical protein
MPRRHAVHWHLDDRVTAVYLTRVYYDYRIGTRRLERISI